MSGHGLYITGIHDGRLIGFDEDHLMMPGMTARDLHAYAIPHLHISIQQGQHILIYKRGVIFFEIGRCHGCIPI